MFQIFWSEACIAGLDVVIAVRHSVWCIIRLMWHLSYSQVDMKVDNGLVPIWCKNIYNHDDDKGLSLPVRSAAMLCSITFSWMKSPSSRANSSCQCYRNYNHLQLINWKKFLGCLLCVKFKSDLYLVLVFVKCNATYIYIYCNRNHQQYQ